MSDIPERQFQKVLALSMLDSTTEDSRILGEFQEMLQFARSLEDFPGMNSGDFSADPENEISFCPLREDEPQPGFSREQVFLNASSVQDEQILLPRIL